jgi:hypothetical protein
MKTPFRISRYRRPRTNQHSVQANLDANVLRQIFRYVSASCQPKSARRQRVMASLCYVCRRWSSVAQEVLYEHVWARSLADARALHRHLAEHEDLCSIVRVLEIPSIWIILDAPPQESTATLPGTNSSASGTSNSFDGGKRYYSFHGVESRSKMMSISNFQMYLSKMRLCALMCTSLEEVRISADIRWPEPPYRSPRVDLLLDLPHTHKFLQRLQLDDGGMHKSTIYDVLPESMKLFHLEELTLLNYSFITPPKLKPFSTPTSPMELSNPISEMPRIRTLRLIHCTSDYNALLPLTRQVATQVQALTIVERQDRFSCSEESEGDAGSGFAHHAIFEPSRHLRHLTLSVKTFKAPYTLKTSLLQSLDITARVFFRGSISDLPSSIRHLSLTFIHDTLHWSALGRPTPDPSRRDSNDAFEELLFILSVDHLIDRLPHLRLLDISLSPSLKDSAACWVKLYQLQKCCRRGRLLLRIHFTAGANRWGVPLGPEGRFHIGLPPHSPEYPSISPTSKRTIRRMLSFRRPKKVIRVDS